MTISLQTLSMYKNSTLEVEDIIVKEVRYVETAMTSLEREFQVLLKDTWLNFKITCLPFSEQRSCILN